MMETVIEKQRCTGCHACFNACPVRAIRMEEDEEGFLYPRIDPVSCIACGCCKSVCPVVTPVVRKGELISYACYAENRDEHLSSSSGAFFSILAEKVLECGGYVCGAAFDQSFQVVHILTNDPQDLARLKGSKYVQSQIGDVYSAIKEKIQQGVPVLFSGTACQVFGLKGYLGKEYENLLTVDLICHGVPSPKIWQLYLSELTGEKQLTGMTFRNKINGIHDVTLDYRFDDGSVYSEKYSDSLYIKGFINNLTLRPSCYSCAFKGTKRCSDLTIGDFWAVKEFHPDFAQEFGVSAVVVHSEKGLDWLQKLDGLRKEQTTAKKISCWNESMMIPAYRNTAREAFFSSFGDLSVFQALERFSRKEYLVSPPQKKKIAEVLKGAAKKWFRS